MMRASVGKISYRPLDDTIAAIDIEGEMTAQQENELMAAYNQAVEAGARAVILNFSRLEFMTSSGIGLLVTLFIRANRGAVQLYAVGLNEHYRKIFELTRLSDNIPVFPTEESALEQARA